MRMLAACLLETLTTIVGQAILPAAGFQPAEPAGKRVRSLDRLPHIPRTAIVRNYNGHHTTSSCLASWQSYRSLDRGRSQRACGRRGGGRWGPHLGRATCAPLPFCPEPPYGPGASASPVV